MTLDKGESRFGRPLAALSRQARRGPREGNARGARVQKQPLSRAATHRQSRAELAALVAVAAPEQGTPLASFLLIICIL